MTTKDELVGLKSDYDREITQFDNLYTQYSSYSRSTEQLHKMKRTLEDEIGEVESKTKDDEQKAENYNRVFLDSRPDLGDPFQPRRIKTLQDFTLFFFSLSYLLLVIAVSMMIYNQTASIKNVLITLFGSGILGFIVFIVMYRYA
jgi:hypothetical protein